MDPKLQLERVNEIRRLLGEPERESLEGRDNRAVAKLNHNERCEIYAYHLCGVPAPIIALVFDVSVNTVYRLKHPTEKSYPVVYRESMQFNSLREFCVHYITEAHEAAIRDMYPEFELIS